MGVVINTPNGRLGRALAERLLGDGIACHLISRHPDKTRDLLPRGAKVTFGSFEDAQVLDLAFNGAHSLYWVTPPPTTPDWASSVLKAAARAAERARCNRLSRVVVQSMWGTGAAHAAGPAAVLREVEQLFQAAVKHVVSLRAACLMENLVDLFPGMLRENQLALPLAPGVALPLVAVADVAAVAKKFLAEPTWNGQRAVGVHGPTEMNGTRIARVLSRALSLKVRYVESPDEEIKRAWTAAGMSEPRAVALLEIFSLIRAGKMVAEEPRSFETTTPTTLKAFAKKALKPLVPRNKAVVGSVSDS